MEFANLITERMGKHDLCRATVLLLILITGLAPTTTMARSTAAEIEGTSNSVQLYIENHVTRRGSNFFNCPTDAAHTHNNHQSYPMLYTHYTYTQKLFSPASGSNSGSNYRTNSRPDIIVSSDLYT